MKVKDIRGMNDQKLKETLNELKSELFNLRFQHATGHLENPMRMGQIRRDIARVKTIMTERKFEGKEA